MGLEIHLWKLMASAEPIEPITTTPKVCLIDRQKIREINDVDFNKNVLLYHFVKALLHKTDSQ